MLRLSTVRTRARSKGNRVLGALLVVLGLLMIAPSVSATETPNPTPTTAPATMPAATRAPVPFPAFGLPFAPGQPAVATGIRSGRVKNAVDLTPRDGLVRAPLGGTVHVWWCAGGSWVTIDHQNGWRTGYYRMAHRQVGDGEVVAPGTVLGTVGTATPCGGRHGGDARVHFTLWQLPTGPAADPVLAGDWHGVSYTRLSTEVATAAGKPFSGKVFGGWRFLAGNARHAAHATRLTDGRTVSLPATLDFR